MTADDPVFVDANIFMYRAGADPAWKKPCERALRRAVESGVRLVTNAEVLQEILHRYFSQRRPAMARTVHRAALRVCAEVIPVTADHTTRALEILIEHPQLSGPDAIHVATMEERDIRNILSADRDFDSVSAVERIDPRDFLRG